MSVKAPRKHAWTKVSWAFRLECSTYKCPANREWSRMLEFLSKNPGREKWLKKYLTMEVVKEAYNDIMNKKEEKIVFICDLMKQFCYSEEMVSKVRSQYDQLEECLKIEGYV